MHVKSRVSIGEAPWPCSGPSPTGAPSRLTPPRPRAGVPAGGGLLTATAGPGSADSPASETEENHTGEIHISQEVKKDSGNGTANEHGAQMVVIGGPAEVAENASEVKKQDDRFADGKGTSPRKGDLHSVADLPCNIPVELQESLDKVKQEIKQLPQGYRKVLSTSVNRRLLDIYQRSLKLPTSARNAIHSQLAEQLSSSKRTFVTKVKKLRQQAQGHSLNHELDQLKKEIKVVMPGLKKQHREEVKVWSIDLKKSEKAENSQGSHNQNSRPRLGQKGKPPLRTFKWTERTNALVRRIVRAKTTMHELSAVPTSPLETYLQAYLDKKVIPLWPKHWMTTREILKKTNAIHKTVGKPCLGNATKQERTTNPKVTSNGQKTPSADQTNAQTPGYRIRTLDSVKELVKDTGMPRAPTQKSSQSRGQPNMKQGSSILPPKTELSPSSTGRGPLTCDPQGGISEKKTEKGGSCFQTSAVSAPTQSVVSESSSPSLCGIPVSQLASLTRVLNQMWALPSDTNYIFDIGGVKVLVESKKPQQAQRPDRAEPSKQWGPSEKEEKSRVINISGSYYPELMPYTGLPPSTTFKPSVMILGSSSGKPTTIKLSDKQSPTTPTKLPKKGKGATLVSEGDGQRTWKESGGFSAHQRRTMLKVFSDNMYLGKDGNRELAEHLGLKTRQVKDFFARQRQMLFKRMTTEGKASLIPKLKHSEKNKAVKCFLDKATKSHPRTLQTQPRSSGKTTTPNLKTELRKQTQAQLHPEPLAETPSPLPGLLLKNHCPIQPHPEFGTDCDFNFDDFCHLSLYEGSQQQWLEDYSSHNVTCNWPAHPDDDINRSHHMADHNYCLQPSDDSFCYHITNKDCDLFPAQSGSDHSVSDFIPSNSSTDINENLINFWDLDKKQNIQVPKDNPHYWDPENFLNNSRISYYPTESVKVYSPTCRKETGEFTNWDETVEVAGCKETHQQINLGPAPHEPSWKKTYPDDVGITNLQGTDLGKVNNQKDWIHTTLPTDWYEPGNWEVNFLSNISLTKLLSDLQMSSETLFSQQSQSHDFGQGFSAHWGQEVHMDCQTSDVLASAASTLYSQSLMY